MGAESAPRSAAGDPQLGRALSSHLQSPSRACYCQNLTEHPLARLCGEGFAPGSQSGEEKGRFGAEEDRFGAGKSVVL